MDLSPEHKKAWHFLGMVTCTSGHIDEAMTCFEKALKIYPASDASQWKDFVTSLGEKLKAVVAGMPRDYGVPESSRDAYLQLGLKLLDEDNLSSAEQVLLTARGDNPDDNDIATWYGIACALSLHYYEAINVWEEVRGGVPDDEKIKILLGIGYLVTCKRSTACDMIQGLRKGGEELSAFSDMSINLKGYPSQKANN